MPPYFVHVTRCLVYQIKAHIFLKRQSVKAWLDLVFCQCYCQNRSKHMNNYKSIKQEDKKITFFTKNKKI